ncbi:MAG: hypothetical protein ABIJ08_04155 [Nanoarchaeota archaeon]
MIGVIIAILLGLALPLGAQVKTILTSLLVIMGLIVGFLNVTGKETKDYMMVAAILVFVSYAAGGAGTPLTQVQSIGMYLESIFQAIMAFVVPATIVVGLKSIMALSKNQ